MRRLLVFLVMVTIVLSSEAQRKEPEWISMPKHSLGLLLGGRLNDMTLSYSGYNKYEHMMLLGPSAGLLYSHRIKGALSLRGDVVYAVRGMELNWCDVKYSMGIHYVDFRPMLQYRLCEPWWNVVPYVALGVECTYALSGKISYESNSISNASLALNQGNIKPFDFGFRTAVGTDIHLDLFYGDLFLIVEAGVDLGLLNNFAFAEQEGNAQILNPELGHTTNIGTRKNRGLEISVGLGIPLVKKKVSSTENLFLGTEFLLEKNRGRDTIYGDNDTNTVIIDTAESEVVISASARYQAQYYAHKKCYTLGEIINLVASGKDVCNLRICMFDIKFAFNSYELTFSSKQKLDRVVKLLKDYPQYNLHVGGHTDSIGSDAYNDRLSINRASAVVNYIIEKGISEERLSYEGFGERYPLESNVTEHGRFINRRVEFELYCTNNNAKQEKIDEENDK